MTNTPKADRTFITTAALVFAASAAVTIVWCGSMSAMPGMEMPGGWTMSMTWMRMPDQSWFGAATTFIGMWVVMMIAMMLPSLVPMLSRYRGAVGVRAGSSLAGLTTLVGAGYFFGVDTLRTGGVSAGHRGCRDCNANPRRVARRTCRNGHGRRGRRLASVHHLEGAPTRLLPRGPIAPDAGGRGQRLAPRPATGISVRAMLSRTHRHAACNRGHGFTRDGARGSSHHRRAPRLLRRSRGAKNRGDDGRGRPGFDSPGLRVILVSARVNC